jgi:hypothetical protein
VRAYGEHHPAIGAVLLDVVVDDGDGPAPLASLRETEPSVRCFITAGTSACSADALLALGALHVFTKPVSEYAEIARTLKVIVGGQDVTGP